MTTTRQRALASLLVPTSAARVGRSVSLVVALRVAGGDVLFAADKRYVIKSDNGIVVRRVDNATKLSAIDGGMIGYAGHAGLARNLLDGLALSGASQVDRMTQLQSGLCEGFARLAPSYSAEDACEFLAADHGRIFVLRSPHFLPQGGADCDFEAIGVTAFARLVCGLLHPNHELTLLGAQRLAALQIAVTADTDPTGVSHKMDMWLLGRGQSAPAAMDNVDSICAWVDSYRRRTMLELHGLESPP